MFSQEYLTWCEVNEFYDPTLFGLHSLYIDIRELVLKYYAELDRISNGQD